ncbi:plasmid stabilization system [Rhizobium leguminosarum bv. trifolii WSM2304]|uniref:Plasmid stabilization system n=1 Tax=Rhizobium leguminosarum bv. trifolii (strain WSM2304) TaxID=395492 RepID=A0ABF7QHS3_RHILW|nr:plasmid stabilization system [Rhizobium leguminosarum bv. trifolii WSM2304]
MRLVWTKRYLKELADINDYIGERNPRAAARVVNDIHSKTEKLLSANPFLGRAGEIRGTRELVIPATPYIHRCLPRSRRPYRSSVCPARRA